MFPITEAYPFAKVGGLGDVGAGLPKALARRGHDVRLVLPGYPQLPSGASRLTLHVPLGRSRQRVDVREHGVHQQVSLWSVAPEGYFADGHVYGYSDGEVAPFIAFGKAVVELAARWEWQPDIIHGHDWHLGLVPQYARQGPHRHTLQRTATLLTIHNLAYQGYLGRDAEALVGLPARGDASLLARGIAHADLVTTVSHRYLREILAPRGGLGLDVLLRRRVGDVFGVPNGLDYEEFDPATDAHIPARYSATCLTSKHLNKAALQRLSGLPVDPTAPLIGMVTRLVEQKGIRLVCASLDALVSRGAQVIIMGLGEEEHRRALEAAAQRHPRAVAYHRTSEEALARQVYAGADLFLAPSEFEPCGLSALIALRYGAVPIVRRTGGLAETVRDSTRDPHTRLGFTFARKSPRALMGAVDRALAVYARPDQWRELRQRGMAARFSWDQAAESYERLYGVALARRAGQSPRLRPAAPSRMPRQSTRRPIPVAFVHHANQYLIADGYDDRQGITRIVEGYRNVLDVHQKHAIPANLHLSGTLVEALAWHCPEFLTQVRALRARGQIGLIGGTYSENVMPLFGGAFNRRQLEELFWLYRRHLGCPPGDLSVCWVPERVWNTSALGPVLTDEHLPNGGYRYVLLDDRLVFATDGAYRGSPRARFDATDTDADADAAVRMHRIAGTRGLVMLPISARFRRVVPPRLPEHWQRVQQVIEQLARRQVRGALLVYADDLERTAGVGGWDGAAFEQYAAFLQWLRGRDDIVPVVLADWLATQAEPPERRVDPGAFFELEQDWGAGDDYSGWSEDAAWACYRRALQEAERAITDAEQAGADHRLVRLAWKHLLASGYETAWHDATVRGPSLAPWARALASHARACLVILAAARWFAERKRGPGAELVDLDGDGEDEVILRNEHVFAVLTTQRGGRLVYLFVRTPRGGVQVVGNPSDDWHLQEELNRFMDCPPNHPGALTEVGFEHDRYQVSAITTSRERASVELTNAQPDSSLHGLTKRLSVASGERTLAVCYAAPSSSGSVAVQTCFSPDYYRLLRHGRKGLRRLDGPAWRGARNANLAVWLGSLTDGATVWTEPCPAEAGHGLNVGLEAVGGHFHLIIGCGRADEGAIQESMARRDDASCVLRA